MHKIFSFIIIVFLCIGIVHAQNEECGTIAMQAQIDYLTQTRSARQNWNSAETTIYIPVQHHVVSETNGTGGLTVFDISIIMNELNTYYINSDIQFYQCDAINYIDDSYNFDFDAYNENTFCGYHDVTGVINIYYFNSVTSSSGSSLCGYSRFPPSVDRVIMKNSCALNGSTIVHELGHYFSLYHTHGKSNCSTTDELVNGSNCATFGDDICDTPADPNLRLHISGYGCGSASAGWVDSVTCAYTGFWIDANSQSYLPNTSNIMSYAWKTCRNFLSVDQYSRVNYSAINDRGYLVCAPGACQADFAFTSTGYSNQLDFIDASSGGFITNWSWDFGDGNVSSQENPHHVYSTGGDYYVCLTVTDITNCTNTYCDSISIVIPGLEDLRSNNFELTAFPNPFTEQTTIQYNLMNTANVNLVIFDLLGNKLETIFHEKQTAGTFNIEWNAEKYTPGLYFVTLTVGDKKVSAKITLMK